MKLNFAWMFRIACFVTVFTLGCGGPRQSNETPTRSTNRISTGNPPPKSTARFQDIAAEAGINFVPRNGKEAGHLSILESLGTGVALFDYDRDDWPDIFFPGGGEFSAEPLPVGLPSAMFRNLGEMKFTSVGVAARVADCPFYSHGSCAGDFDSDGFPDLLITGYRGLLLYRNQGDGTFIDTTAEAGLTLRSWSTSATWGDANGDGILDLYIANYVDWSFEKHPACIVQGQRDICAPKEFQPLSDVFYLGNGDGTFCNATTEVGLVPGGKGLGVIAADLDNDGDLDYYVANDTTPNFLYRNDGHGHFREVGLISGTAFGEMGEAEGSMGIDVGDFNGDGLADIWVANFENQSFALYRNQGDCQFLHVSGVMGITAVGSLQVGFGTCFIDFDLDGDEDIFAANGHVMYHSTNAPLGQKPLLLENLAGRRFVNVASDAGDYMASPHVGRGVACGDLDRDGDPDLVVSHINEPVSLLRNDTPQKKSSLQIRLVGKHTNRDAVGARVILRSPNGATVRQIKGSAGYLSSSMHELTVGGISDSEIQSVEVLWPQKSTQLFSVKKARKRVCIVEVD